MIPVGIGIDTTTISEIARLDREVAAFTERTFSERERFEAAHSRDRDSYLAGRFAVKEAAFKAIAQLTGDGSFDMRIVETLRDPDGSPHIQMDGRFGEVCRKADVAAVFVSLTNEGDFATAIVLAYRKIEGPQGM